MCCCLFLIFLIVIYSWERETSASGGWGAGRERGRHRIWNRLQALSYQHRAWRGTRTHQPWDHDLSWCWELNRPSHPGAPLRFLLHLPEANLPKESKVENKFSEFLHVQQISGLSFHISVIVGTSIIFRQKIISPHNFKGLSPLPFGI